MQSPQSASVVERRAAGERMAIETGAVDVAPAQLSVILVDTSRERGEVLATVLAGEGYRIAATVLPDMNLLDAIEEHQPDVVVIDMDSPDRDTLELLRSVQNAVPRPMVMFAQDDDGETIRRAVHAGVSAYVVDGLQTKRVRPVVDAAIARFRQYRALQDELDSARAQLTHRKLIARAKGILMQQKGCTEEEAYRQLRTIAMNRNKRLVEVADSLITAFSLLE